ncbi:hypothetical protein D3C76_1644180 [compost metagenome]
MVFYENDIKVSARSTKFKEDTKETRKDAALLPKLQGKHIQGIDREYFKINFNHFSSFGQYPETVGRYKLHSSRM